MVNKKQPKSFVWLVHQCCDVWMWVKHIEMCAFFSLITPAEHTLIQDIVLLNILCWSQAEHLDYIWINKYLKLCAIKV